MGQELKKVVLNCSFSYPCWSKPLSLCRNESSLPSLGIVSNACVVGYKPRKPTPTTPVDSQQQYVSMSRNEVYLMILETFTTPIYYDYP